MEEEYKLLEVAYEEARSEYPDFKRELLYSDFKGKVVSGGTIMYTFPEEITDDFGRVVSRSKLTTFSSRETDEISRGRVDTINLTKEYLKENGFSSLHPLLREFVQKHGLEYEVRMFVKLYGKRKDESWWSASNESMEKQRREDERRMDNFKRRHGYDDDNDTPPGG